MSRIPKVAATLGIVAAAAVMPAASLAQGLFEALFGGFRHAARAPVQALQQPFIFGDERPERRGADMTSGGNGGAFCVRICDGRYFPAPAAGGQSRANVCNSFCPATETKVFYGSSIDHARGADGRPYSALKSAFRYRSELVADCTCNGRDPVGLARIDVNEDPTLRRGDIVASGGGLVIATGSRRGGASFAEMPASIRASFAKMPVVAKD